jgi:hypothetical protein
MRPRNEGGAVLMGAGSSLLLQPREFIESRNEAEAMVRSSRSLSSLVSRSRRHKDMRAQVAAVDPCLAVDTAA